MTALTVSVGRRSNGRTGVSLEITAHVAALLMHGDQLLELGSAVDDARVRAENPLEQHADGLRDRVRDQDDEPGRPDLGDQGEMRRGETDHLRADE